MELEHSSQSSTSQARLVQTHIGLYADQDNGTRVFDQPSTSYAASQPDDSSSTVTAVDSENGVTVPTEEKRGNNGPKRKHDSSTTLTATESEHGSINIPEYKDISQDIFATPRKRRKFTNKRYCGDWSSEATITPTKGKRRIQMAKRRIAEQAKKIRNLQQTRRRLKRRIVCMKSLLKYFKSNHYISDSAHNVIMATQPDETGEIMKRFLAGPSKTKYSPALRAFALTLHFYSAKAYNYVRQKFNNTLPHPRTISQWYQAIDGSPGFTKEAKRSLEAKVSEAGNKNQKVICNFVMDEMAIKRKVEWDGTQFVGYVDLGTELSGDELVEAKEALVFMLVPLNGRWKIPIGYFLLDGLSAAEKANLVNQAFEFLHPTGVIVTSMTFDGTATNLSMATQLGANFDNPTQLKTWFMHPVTQEKIFIFLDACHMLKLLRNCLSVYQHLLNSTTGGIITWAFIEKLVKLQEDEGLHMGTKLRRRHLNWSDQPMKVNLAAQIFSNSVANALLALENDFQMEEFQGVEATAEFLTNINDVFDILNSKNKFCKVTLRRGLSEANKIPVFRRLTEIKDYLCNLTLMNGVSVTKCRRKTGFIGFLVCIDSLMGLYNVYVAEKELLTYILSYKLSQDHLELFFSAMRNRLGMNNNPTAREFGRSYKRLIVHTEVGPSVWANVVALDSTSILHCSSATSLTKNRIGDTTEDGADSLDMFQQFVNDHDYLGAQAWTLTDYTADVIAYIAGFVVRSLKRSVVCNKCLQIMQGDEVLSKLQIRKTYGSLQKPSRFTILVCKEGEKAVRYLTAQSQLFLQNTHSINILITNIIRSFSKEVFLPFGDHVLDDEIWDNHSLELTKFILKKYINVRMYHEASKLSNNRTLRKKLTKTILFRHE